MKDNLRQNLQEYIDAHREVPLTHLCDEFHISMSTVRRYVDSLVKEGLCSKYYGGVRSNTSPQSTLARNTSENPLEREKRKIAEQAAKFICEDDIIYIDSGSTTRYILDYVPVDISLTVITNNYFAIQSAVNLINITVITLPGIFDRKTHAFISERAVSFLDTFNIHKAFLACTGITIQNGATNTYSEEHATKAQVARKAHEIFLLADHRKFGISTLMTYCKIENIQTIITDAQPPKEFTEAFGTIGNRLIITR